MLQALGDRLSSLARRYVPDPFVLAILLTLVSIGGALLYTGFDAAGVLTAWLQGGGGGKGFWNLLAFGMQMCLILVTGHALAESPPIARVLNALTDRVRTPAGAVIIVSVCAMVLGLANWGLGLIAGALLARKVGQRARERGIAVHYPLLVAAGYTGLLVWHGGLSGSAPLKVTLEADLAEVLGSATAATIGSIPLGETIGSPMNLLVNLALLITVPWILVRMLPRDPEARTPAPDLGSTELPPDDDQAGEKPTPAERLERSLLLVLAIVVPGLIAWALAVQKKGIGRLDLNLINFVFVYAGLLLHGSARSYARAIGEGAKGCGGIILQFPFYAGIMSLLAGSGLLEVMAAAVAQVGSTFLPAVGFYMAGLVNLFVPSGGGQWAVQGPLLIEAGLQAGVEPAKMVMALVYGDQWTNMLQPFWALPLLAITGVKARDIIGYTAVLLLCSQLIFVGGLYLLWW